MLTKLVEDIEGEYHDYSSNTTQKQSQVPPVLLCWWCWKSLRILHELIIWRYLSRWQGAGLVKDIVGNPSLISETFWTVCQLKYNLFGRKCSFTSLQAFLFKSNLFQLR